MILFHQTPIYIRQQPTFYQDTSISPMQETYHSDKTFDRIDSIEKGEYEACRFDSCNFSNSNLSDFVFTDCTFTHCNLSLARLDHTAFREVRFRDCKLLGLRFEFCNDFGLAFSFENCQLNHTTFFRKDIRNTVFRNCQLKESDFTEANLTSVVFDLCDLSKAVFDRTILEHADFRTAYGYSIDPELNRLKKTRFSLAGLPGLLNRYDIVIDNG